MIAGDAMRTGPTGVSHYTWSCDASDVSSTAVPPLCPAGSSLELLLRFPDCWDGVHLDSADHRAHVAYSAGKQCPVDHPVPIAALEFKLRWPTRGGAGITLASGNGYSAHGDFINAWDPAALAARVQDCLRAGRKCGVDGVPLP